MAMNNRVLIVDDDPGVRESYTAILTADSHSEVIDEGSILFGDNPCALKHQYQVCYDLTVTESGEQAVKEVQSHFDQNVQFAIAFVDMQMYGMDGAETAKKIWEIDPKIKIVIVTAYSEYSPEEIVDKTQREDIFYLRKPFNPEEIRQFAKSLTKQWQLENEKEQLQNELKQINANLETIVQQRTEELSEAYEQLKTLDKEKFTFLTFLSHELNTPLNWIAAKEVMDREELSNTNLELLGMIDDGFDRLNQCVMSALSYFENSSRKLELKHTTVSIRQLTNESIDSLVDRANPKRITITNTIDDNLYIEIDQTYFSKTLNILIDNAISFSNEQSEIRIFSQANQNGTLKIIIEDDGVGIPQENIQDIFKPFTVKEFDRHKGGYGLNLPIAKKICDAHGWSLRAESNGVGHGARFIIEKSSKL